MYVGNFAHMLEICHNVGNFDTRLEIWTITSYTTVPHAYKENINFIYSDSL